MLKVLIDGTPITKRFTGVSVYITHLIHSLVQLKMEHLLRLEVGYQPSLKNWLQGNYQCSYSFNTDIQFRYLSLPIRLSNPLFLNFPSLFQRFCESSFDYPDVIHGTNYFVYPSRHSSNILTLYDLTFIKYPELVDRVAKKYNTQVRKCLEWTDLIITISESSKRDIIQYLDIPKEKIFVTPLASRYSGKEISITDFSHEKMSSYYDFKVPYLLFVSTLEPRKNINGLITAFNYLKEKYKIPHHLVLVGQKGWLYEPIFQAINQSRYKNHIHHLNYLSDEEVAYFYQNAEVFVYPSFYEGFGLPVLEAMTLGTPVVTSNRSSLPEVTGNAGLLVDPDDSIELANNILKIIENSEFRQILIKEGKQQAQQFSWLKTAELTLKAYQFAQERSQK